MYDCNLGVPTWNPARPLYWMSHCRGLGGSMQAGSSITLFDENPVEEEKNKRSVRQTESSAINTSPKGSHLLKNR